MPFTLRNLKADLEDVGSNFDGDPDLEFRMATKALELEESGLSFQSIPPRKRSLADVDWGDAIRTSPGHGPAALRDGQQPRGGHRSTRLRPY